MAHEASDSLPEPTYKCRYCQKTLHSRTGIYLHERKKHAEQANNDMMQRKKKRKGSIPYICRYCNMPFPFNWSRRYHEISVHGCYVRQSNAQEEVPRNISVTRESESAATVTETSLQKQASETFGWQICSQENTNENHIKLRLKKRNKEPLLMCRCGLRFTKEHFLFDHQTICVAVAEENPVENVESLPPTGRSKLHQNNLMVSKPAILVEDDTISDQTLVGSAEGQSPVLGSIVDSEEHETSAQSIPAPVVDSSVNDGEEDVPDCPNGDNEQAFHTIEKHCTTSLKEYQCQHVLAMDRPFECQCGRDFEDKNHLNNHRKACNFMLKNGLVYNASNFCYHMVNNECQDRNGMTLNPGPSVAVEENDDHAIARSELGSQEERLSPGLTRSPGTYTESDTIVQNNISEEVELLFETSTARNKPDIPQYENSPATYYAEEKASSIIVATSASDDEDEIQIIYEEDTKSRLKARNIAPMAQPQLYVPLRLGICETATTRLPLSVVIFSILRENPAEMLVVYLTELEPDAIGASTMFSDRCILVVHNLNLLKQADLWQNMNNNKPQMVTASIQTSPTTFAAWSLITFNGAPLPMELKNRQLSNMSELENVLLKFAAQRQRNLTNLIRHTGDGLYHHLTQRLSAKTIGCNFAA